VRCNCFYICAACIDVISRNFTVIAACNGMVQAAFASVQLAAMQFPGIYGHCSLQCAVQAAFASVQLAAMQFPGVYSHCSLQWYCASCFLICAACSDAVFWNLRSLQLAMISCRLFFQLYAHDAVFIWNFQRCARTITPFRTFLNYWRHFTAQAQKRVVLICTGSRLQKHPLLSGIPFLFC
jgi:hypothetical protein